MYKRLNLSDALAGTKIGKAPNRTSARKSVKLLRQLNGLNPWSLAALNLHILPVYYVSKKVSFRIDELSIKSTSH